MEVSLYQTSENTEAVQSQVEVGLAGHPAWKSPDI